MENIKNPESVKSIVGSNWKMGLTGNIQGFDGKEILQFICKLKNQYNGFL